MFGTKMEYNNYPKIKNALLLMVLFKGIILASVIVIILSSKVFTIDSNSPISDMLKMAATILGYVVVFKIGLTKSKRSFAKTFKFNKVPVLTWLIFSVTMIGFIILLPEMNNLVRLVLPIPQFFIDLLKRLTVSKNILLSIFIVTIIPPVFEEMFFRGLIVDGFRRNYSLSKTIFFSSLLFGLTHLNPWQFVSAFFLGLFFSWICIKTNSILLPILGHFLSNLSAIIIMRYAGTLLFQTRSPLGFQPLWLDACGAFLFGSGLILLDLIFKSNSHNNMKMAE